MSIVKPDMLVTLLYSTCFRAKVFTQQTLNCLTFFSNSFNPIAFRMDNTHAVLAVLSAIGLIPLSKLGDQKAPILPYFHKSVKITFLSTRPVTGTG